MPQTSPLPTVFRQRVLRLGLLLSALGGSNGAVRAESLPLQVYAEDAPPLSIVDTRPMRGPVLEAVRSLLQQAGQSTEILSIPWARAYMNGLNRPNTALFGVARVPSRENQFLWIGELYRNQTYVYRLATRDDIPQAPLKELNQYRIAIVRGTSLSERLQRLGFTRERIQEVTGARQRIPLLATGRVDLMTFNSAAVDYYLGLYSGNVRLVRVAAAHDEPLHQYLVLNRDSDPALVAALSQAYQALRASGRFTPIDTISTR